MTMTPREEAYSLIAKLPDKVMEDIVRELKRMFDSPLTWETPEQEKARKMQAFQEMERMRKTCPLRIPEDYETEYEDVILEKHKMVMA